MPPEQEEEVTHGQSPQIGPAFDWSVDEHASDRSVDCLSQNDVCE